MYLVKTMCSLLILIAVFITRIVTIAKRYDDSRSRLGSRQVKANGSEC